MPGDATTRSQAALFWDTPRERTNDRSHTRVSYRRRRRSDDIQRPQGVTAVFSRHDHAADLAPRLSCIEVEALAGLLRALGEPATADTWIGEHAPDDELGDAHYQGDTLEYLVPIDPKDDLGCDNCQ